jgi:hypothetical protein
MKDLIKLSLMDRDATHLTTQIGQTVVFAGPGRTIREGLTAVFLSYFIINRGSKSIYYDSSSIYSIRIGAVELVGLVYIVAAVRVHGL